MAESTKSYLKFAETMETATGRSKHYEYIYIDKLENCGLVHIYPFRLSTEGISIVTEAGFKDIHPPDR